MAAKARRPCAVADGIRTAFALILAGLALTSSADAEESRKGQAAAVWTVVIPKAFPGNICVWRLKPDGTYEEDGRDAKTESPIQETMRGRWSIEGTRMVLQQDRIPYVFRGLVIGDDYSGDLYFGKRVISNFCAIKGSVKVPRCGVE